MRAWPILWVGLLLPLVLPGAHAQVPLCDTPSWQHKDGHDTTLTMGPEPAYVGTISVTSTTNCPDGSGCPGNSDEVEFEVSEVPGPLVVELEPASAPVNATGGLFPTRRAETTITIWMPVVAKVSSNVLITVTATCGGASEDATQRFEVDPIASLNVTANPRPGGGFEHRWELRMVNNGNVPLRVEIGASGNTSDGDHAWELPEPFVLSSRFEGVNIETHPVGVHSEADPDEFEVLVRYQATSDDETWFEERLALPTVVRFDGTATPTTGPLVVLGVLAFLASRRLR